jgi:hypothetical protein
MGHLYISLHHNDSIKLFLLLIGIWEHEIVDWELQIKTKGGLWDPPDFSANCEISGCVIHSLAVPHPINLYFNDRNYSLNLHSG